MRRSFVLLPAGVAGLVLFLAPAVHARSADAVQFVTGTTNAIPHNAAGSIDTTDAINLRFCTGDGLFVLPWTKITGTAIAEPETKRVWKMRVPAMHEAERLLTINYRDDDKTGTLTFRATATMAASLSDKIESQRKAALEAAAMPQRPAEKTWWGDSWWRTNRNHAKWQSPDADSQTAVGTKE